MPANLPPMYFEAEKRFRDAKTSEEKVRALEEMLAIMPKHKGTDKLKADLRRKIARFKTEAQQRKGGARRETAYSIDKEGAAQVAVIGPPNSGKSSLVAALTNATPEIADFPHTTWRPLPGMANFKDIQFQLIDTPPLSREYADPYIADLLRRADILLVLLDIQGDPLEQIEQVLTILSEWRIFPEGASIPEDLRKPPSVKKTLLVLNKVDGAEEEEDYRVFLELAEVRLPSMALSVSSRRNLDGLLKQIYDLAGIIRVYTKAPGKEAERNAPFVMPKESTLDDLAGRVHKDFQEKLRYARIWGKGVFDGQMVQRDYVLQDGDVAEFHI
ncbi:MAG: TGS domain-containing protein [Desulfobacteraceae bacterium]|nr:MAG: TGS domain-containing protein [Desulfobacteraceae bacterium]